MHAAACHRHTQGRRLPLFPSSPDVRAPPAAAERAQRVWAPSALARRGRFWPSPGSARASRSTSPLSALSVRLPPRARVHVCGCARCACREPTAPTLAPQRQWRPSSLASRGRMALRWCTVPFLCMRACARACACPQACAITFAMSVVHSDGAYVRAYKHARARAHTHTHRCQPMQHPQAQSRALWCCRSGGGSTSK